MSVAGAGIASSAAAGSGADGGARSIFRRQDYAAYTAGDHAVWSRLFARIEPLWVRHASAAFLRGVERLGLERRGIPRLERINARLAALTGFRAVGVGGYLPASDFFGCLAARRFPVSLTIRDAARLDYLPEPDIFHDVAGHAPMQTDGVFADTLARFGRLAAAAGGCLRRVEALARLFWFTVEFGLIREGGRMKAYGSGLMSSAGELRHALEEGGAERVPFDLERVLGQAFSIDRYQPRLFVIESFEQLYGAVGEAEARFRGAAIPF